MKYRIGTVSGVSEKTAQQNRKGLCSEETSSPADRKRKTIRLKSHLKAG